MVKYRSLKSNAAMLHPKANNARVPGHVQDHRPN
jgi:hypothetical protein